MSKLTFPVYKCEVTTRFAPMGMGPEEATPVKERISLSDFPSYNQALSPVRIVYDDPKKPQALPGFYYGIEISKISPMCECESKFQYQIRMSVGNSVSLKDGTLWVEYSGAQLEEQDTILFAKGNSDEIPVVLEAKNDYFGFKCSRADSWSEEMNNKSFRGFLREIISGN